LHGAVLDQQINDWRSKSLGLPDASAIDQIRLRHDGTAINLTKTDGRWRIDGQGVQRASGEAVKDLIASANRLTITGFAADNPENLGLYGLDKPQLQLVIETPPSAPTGDDATTTAAVTHKLSIGRTDLRGSARYATWTRDGEQTLVVFTVNTSNADALARSVDDLRDPRVVVASPQDVRELKVQRAGETTLHVIRDPQAGYRFGDPRPGFEIDYSTSHDLIQQLCDLEAATYTTALKDLGEPTAEVTLGMTTGDGDVNFNVYGDGDNLTLVNRGEGVGYVVQADKLRTLLGPPLGLRKRTVMDVTPDQITRVVLKRPDGVTYEFTHVTDGPETGWRLTGQQRFEDKSFDSLLGSLGPLRAQAWLPTHSSNPSASIELTLDATGQPQQVLTVAPDTRVASLNDIDMAFTLPQPVVDLLNAEYRDRTAIDLNVDQIQSVRVANDSTDITVSRDGQRFVSDRGEVDQAVAAGVFDALAGLRVQRYVAPLHPRPQDIDFSVELTTSDGETRTLRLIDSGGDAVTVSLDPQGDRDYARWFTLDREVVARLRAPLTETQTPIK